MIGTGAFRNVKQSLDLIQSANFILLSAWPTPSR